MIKPSVLWVPANPIEQCACLGQVVSIQKMPTVFHQDAIADLTLDSTPTGVNR